MAKRKNSKQAVGGKGKLAQALSRQRLLEQHQKKIADKEKKLEQQEKQKKLNKNKPKHFKKTNENETTNEHVMATQRPFIPFQFDDHVLLVGEGDFSYALSIVNSEYINPENLIATSFDSLKGLIEKYQDVEENLKVLSEKGVKIFHEIDATNLIKSFQLATNFKKNKQKNKAILGTDSINLIMFNFPHSGKGIKDQDRNIKAHQLLMAEFFGSCLSVFKLLQSNKNYLIRNSNTPTVTSSSIYGYSTGLSSNTPGSNDHITNSSLNGIAVTLFNGEPYDSWQIKRIARESANYKVKGSGAFRWDAFPGYHHRRTNSMKQTTKEASERDAKCYVFEKFVASKHGNKKNKSKNSDDESDSDDE